MARDVKRSNSFASASIQVHLPENQLTSTQSQLHGTREGREAELAYTIIKVSKQFAKDGWLYTND